MMDFSGGQCPGECYDEFWKHPIKVDSLSLDEILKRYEDSQAQRPFFYFVEAESLTTKGQKLLAKFEDLSTATKLASQMENTGNWVINSILRSQ